MSSLISRRHFLLSSLAYTTSCASSLQNFPFDRQGQFRNLGLQIQFYGVGCFRISFDGQDILSDPFFSYLPFPKVAFGKIQSDPKQVDPYLPQLKNVQTVIVGHNHYDHNLDLAYVTPHLHSNAIILGSKTLKHTFAPLELKRPIVDINANVAGHKEMGEWWYHPNRRVRILPILSKHPNQYLFFHLFTRSLKQDRIAEPQKVFHYQEGLTFAFLIDFIGDNRIQRRVYIQTTSTGFPMGSFPKTILKKHPIDVALLSMDSANIAMKNKYSILDFLDSNITFFCHYENFFRPKDEEPKEIVKVNLQKSRDFFKNTNDKTYYFPAFDAIFNL